MKPDFAGLKVLALSPHPDDAELGCGATLNKLIRQGAQVRVWLFTEARDVVPKGWRKDTHRHEFVAAMKALGLPVTFVYDFPHMAFESTRQKILELLYEERDWPDVVFCPSSFTSNQDHQTIHNEAKRAFRVTTVWGYATPSGDYGFARDAVYSVVYEQDLKAKVKALACYRSQFERKRPYFGEEYTRSLARVTGVECWQPLAEKFENIRTVVK